MNVAAPVLANAPAVAAIANFTVRKASTVALTPLLATATATATAGVVYAAKTYDLNDVLSLHLREACESVTEGTTAGGILYIAFS